MRPDHSLREDDILQAYLFQSSQAKEVSCHRNERVGGKNWENQANSN